MSERDRRADAKIYGFVLVLALIGGAVALLGSREEPEPPATNLRPVPTSTDDDSFVPNLPAVPNLATDPPPARTGDDDPRGAQLTAEMRYLSRARELLAQHPGEALSVLEQHRRQHPAGMLREEREAFAIEALASLDRHAEAERRYYDFVRDFPRSSFLPRLAAAMRTER